MVPRVVEWVNLRVGCRGEVGLSAEKEGARLSLDPSPIEPVPEEAARVARAIFPKGNRSLLLRDTLGTLFSDPLFADLFPPRGQPALAPWRLALVTLFGVYRRAAGSASG